LIRSSGAIRTTRPPAVVVGLDCITGLQTARLLDERSVPVIGVVADTRHFCSRTRLPVAIVRAPLRGPALVDALVDLGRRLDGPAVLMPCTDAAVLAISEGRDRLADGFRFVLPEHDVVARLMDKVGFAEHALASGLPIPATAILRTPADAERAAAEPPFPIVLKPGLKGLRWTAATKAKAIPVQTPAELPAAYQACRAWTDVLIAQTWIPGPEDGLVSVNTYHDRTGTQRISFVARKLRQWPLDTGTSCLGEEVREPRAAALASAVFGSVAYRGLGYVETKEDPRSGQWLIIEPNIGRPTGRSAIAEKGGVELLLSAYRDALGEPLPEATVQRYRGVKWIYWRHDLQAAAVRARRGELSMGQWLASVRGPKTEAVFARRDPAPFAADVVGTAGVAARSIAKAAASFLDRRGARRRDAADAPTPR
jgi:D-aspartate ligase